MRFPFFLLALSTLFLFQCVDPDDVDEEDLEELIEQVDQEDIDKVEELVEENTPNGCEGETLESLMTTNSISAECKESLQSYLPGPENNINNNLVKMGLSETDDQLVLNFLLTDENGNHVIPGAEDIAVFEMINNEWVENSDVELDPEAVINPRITFSSILDYSGSMSEQDIKDGLEVFSDLFFLTHFIDNIEVNHLAFSDSVTSIFDYTNDGNEISDQLSFQSQIERNSTSLLDGMGDGMTSLIARQNAFRVAVVMTDGAENNSSRYGFDDVVQLSNDHNIPIIAIGALLSDLSFFKKLTGNTNSFFIYAKKILQTKDELQSIGEMLSDGITRITLPNTESKMIKIEVGEKSVVFQK